MGIIPVWLRGRTIERVCRMRAYPSRAQQAVLARLVGAARRGLCGTGRWNGAKACQGRTLMLLFSGSRPGMTDGRLLKAEEVVSVILDGVRVRDGRTRRGRRRC